MSNGSDVEAAQEILKERIHGHGEGAGYVYIYLLVIAIIIFTLIGVVIKRQITRLKDLSRSVRREPYVPLGRGAPKVCALAGIGALYDNGTNCAEYAPRDHTKTISSERHETQLCATLQRDRLLR